MIVANVLRLDEVDQDDFDLEVKEIFGKIAAETKTFGGKFMIYSNIDRENILAFSETLYHSLLHILLNLKKSVPAAMISSIITSIITTKPTMFQGGLGFVVHHKHVIEHLHEYRVTSPYHEVRRFKISSAASNTEISRLTDFDVKNGLIQVISDNFEAHIHTQNELKQTNGMVTIGPQSNSTPPASLLSPLDSPLIPRFAQKNPQRRALKRGTNAVC